MSQESTAQREDKVLFWGCFVALIATAFGFVIRTMVMNEWAADFNLSPTQKGEIFGVGLWPFAISIVLFSLVIDRIGYGRSMVFAFVCHIVSAVITIATPYVAHGDSETGYWMLYIGTFIVAIGNGTVEAVINPVVATIFWRNKAKWLNILHAGWPGGMLLGGVIAVILDIIMGGVSWQLKVGLVFLPTIAYGIMLFGRKFPVHERVAAGVSDLSMLKEVGFAGAFIISALVVKELSRVLVERELMMVDWSESARWGAVFVAALIIAGGFAAYVQSFGRPLFIFLLLIMIPLATTELGTDSWITPLMEGEMGKLGLPPVALLLYTSFIMMVLRFCAGPIIHRLSPLGLLAMSAALAALGLYTLSLSAGIVIIIAATIYAMGKTFFWPTMLGVVAEQFPRGGAMTLNTIAAVGMLSVGILGAPFLGAVQDSSIRTDLQAWDSENQTTLHGTYITMDKVGIFGNYLALDKDKLQKAPEADVAVVTSAEEAAGKKTLRTVALFPVIMLACYMILIVYFKSQGGYKAIHLEASGAEATD